MPTLPAKPIARPSVQETEREVQIWVRKFNLSFTPGDYVILRDDHGRETPTMVDSPARIEGGLPVADFRGVEWPARVDGGRVRHLTSTAA
jgi:hypothetical protein